MTYKISVIIPVYNAEKTLNRAINSILNQKWDGDLLKDIEILLIDDCSKDKSKEIIKDYSNNYSNIKYLSTEKNSGSPAQPRNIGIKHSTGNYLMFLDNDDEYCPDLCKTLYQTITAENADIVSCNFCDIDDYRIYKEYRDYFGENLVLKDSMVIYDELDATFFVDILIWTKIFKKSLITENNITFPNYADDTFFSTESFINAKKLVYLKDYYGIKRYVSTESLSHSVTLDTITTHISALLEVWDMFKNSKYDVENYKYKFETVKYNIKTILTLTSYLENNKDYLIALNKLYDYEKYVSFNEKLGNPVFDVVNFFILKRQIKIAFLILKIMHIFVNMSFFRFIYNTLRVFINNRR